MSTANTAVDYFNKTEDEVFEPNMMIESNNVRFNPPIEDYPEELKMLVQLVMTRWFYYYLQKDDENHNIPDGIERQQDAGCPNSSITIRRIV
ncbi:unnamed protein product [Lactuca virosa]|uniref:Uncharacterized protein n=1 Tax=Lactuca virosa TaxID=75947 RepID=A0AAU9NC66_9ASTR|nr:unnamed protein product [Lactuca virosa]